MINTVKHSKIPQRYQKQIKSNQKRNKTKSKKGVVTKIVDYELKKMRLIKSSLV